MKELTPDEHKILVDAIQDSATVVHKGQKDMNERIKELAEQVYGSAHYDDFKFAELIVRECALLCESRLGPGDDVRSRQHCSEQILEHFGVES